MFLTADCLHSVNAVLSTGHSVNSSILVLDEFDIFNFTHTLKKGVVYRDNVLNNLLSGFSVK